MEQNFLNQQTEQEEQAQHGPYGAPEPPRPADIHEEANRHGGIHGEPPKDKKHGHPWWAVAVTVLLVAGLAFGGGYAGYAAASARDNKAAMGNGEQKPAQQSTPVKDPVSTTVTTVPAGSELTAAQVAKKVMSSVVAITTEKMTTGNYWFGSQVTGGAGSGVILTQDGYIVTNSHVISGADTITVELHDGTTYPAEVRGVYYDSDLAVVKIEATGLTPAVFGDSDSVVQGDTIYAVGNPEGTFNSSITSGIISALNRTIDVSLEVEEDAAQQDESNQQDPFAGFGKKQDNGQNNNQSGGYVNGFGDLFGQMFGYSNGSSGSMNNAKAVTLHVFQFDAAVSPGNSGGGLFDGNGTLVGIVCAKSSDTDAEGLGFAINGNRVNRITTSLISTGTYEPTEEEKQEMAAANEPAVSANKAVLGITVATLDAATAMEYGYTSPGVYVIDITEDSTKAAGVQVGDRIISADDIMVSSSKDLTTYLADKEPGQKVTLHVEREGKMLSISVTLLQNAAAAKEN